MHNNTQPTEENEIPQEARGFLESLLNDAGMTSLDERMHKQMINELFVRLDNFMLSTIVDKLPPEKLEDFTKMSENRAIREDLEKYLRENIPNAEAAFADALGEFRELYLGNVAVARNAPEESQPTQPAEELAESDKNLNVN